MTRTIKLPYRAEGRLVVVLSDLRRRQSRLIRVAYNCLVGGLGRSDLYRELRQHPTGQQLHTWLILSGMKRAQTLHGLHPGGKVVFGGRRAAILRAQGKITADDWKARRLQPLYVEGHAKSFGPQGGNHLFSLDMANNRVVFHAPSGDHALQLKLSRKSRGYRRRLEELQARCEQVRDVPFTVQLTDCHIAITWTIPAPPARTGKEKRVLALDLNPNRIGWAVVDGLADQSCTVPAWGVFEYSTLNVRLRLPSTDPRRIAQNHKRRHELSIIAKELETLARHYQVSAVVTERLGLGPRDYGRGKGFNRLVNCQWFRRGFTATLARRLAEAGITQAEVNPAYSSKIGNLLWAEPLGIPDPACAAVELGRRALFPLPFQAPPAKPRSPKQVQPRKHGPAGVRPAATLHGWRRVWSQIKPQAADPRRFCRKRLDPMLHSGNPRLAPLPHRRSKVARIEPREGTSEPFGREFGKFLAEHAAPNL